MINERQRALDELTISCEEFAAMRDTSGRLSGFTLLDVREPEEHIESAIPGDVLIPQGELWERAPRELDRTKPLIVYCAHGIRSLHAALALKQLGFEQVRSLSGGIAAWEIYQSERRTSAGG